MPNSFIMVKTPDFHKVRRKEMLHKYPEIRNLFGHEPKTKYIASAIVLLEFLVAIKGRALPWFWWLTLAYVLGATLNHALFTAIHEVGHNLAFQSKKANRLFALFINLPLGIPTAISFEKYHQLHHRFLGDPKKDGDVPLISEAKLFNSVYGKFLWLLVQPLTYSIRPMIKWPQKISSWELANVVVQCVANGFVIYFWGFTCFAFFIVSTLMGMSLHPLATHFIAEHYVAHHDQETYSYYGLLNYFTFNFGHHVEHHDFPGIPWSRTSLLRKIAPEYYDHLYTHHSWVGFMKEFIFSRNINLFSRVTR